MGRPTREAIIDWGNYSDPYSDEAIFEVAGAHCEAGKTENLFERINDFSPRRSEKIDTGREHGEAELVAHRNSFELMDSGHNLVVWISPPGGIYFEGRINFMVNRNGVFEGWGIPAMRSGEQLVMLAKELEVAGGITMDGFETVEQLRQQPIGFEKFDEETRIWLEEVFGLKGFWEYVDGEQKARKAKVIQATRESLRESSGNNEIYFQRMAKRGYELMVATDHGGGGVVTNTVGVSGFQMSRSGNLIIKEVNGKRICPCGEVLKEGSTRCPKCGLGLVIN